MSDNRAYYQQNTNNTMNPYQTQGYSRPEVDPFDDPFYDSPEQMYAPQPAQQHYPAKPVSHHEYVAPVKPAVHHQEYCNNQTYSAPGSVHPATLPPAPPVDYTATETSSSYNYAKPMVEDYAPPPTSYQFRETQEPQVKVDFFQTTDYSLPRFNSEVTSNQKRFGSNYTGVEDHSVKKRQKFRVDSFYDNIPVVENKSKTPLGTLDDFFADFDKKTTISDIPVRKTEKSKLEVQSEQIARLRNLGFEDEERNKQLLKAYDNDIDKVVKHLIDLERLKNRAEKKDVVPKTVTTTTSIKSTSGTTTGTLSNPASISEQKFEIRVGELKNLTYNVNIYDEKNTLSHKAVLLLHSCIILKDRTNQTLSRVVKDDLHLHPTYSVSRSGKRLAQCSERFKFGVERKFNYRMFTGDVLKMTGTYGKDWIVKKNGVVLAHVVQKAPKRYEVLTKSQLVSHILTLCMIMLERRYTSMRAVVLV